MAEIYDEDLDDFVEVKDGAGAHEPPSDKTGLRAIPGATEYSVRHLDRLIAPNPADVGWPPTLAAEIALQAMTPRQICEAYKISAREWDEIRQNPSFIAELHAEVESLKGEGNNFKKRCQAMALGMTADVWAMTHDPAVPAAVRGDLIKKTVEWAGFAPKDNGKGAGDNRVQFAINIQMRDR